MEGWISALQGYFDGFQFHRGPISIYIENGKIRDISRDKILSPVIDGSKFILTPPFVDGHTHLIFGGNRFDELPMKLKGLSYNEILEKGGGIQSTVKNTRQASVEELSRLLLQRLDTMLQNGTMIVEIKSGYGLSTEEEIRLLEIIQSIDHEISIVPTFGAAHVVPPEVSRKQYIDMIIDEMLPVVVKRSLATTTDVFCDRGAFTIDETINIFEASSKLQLPVRVHAEELEYTGIGKLASSKFNVLSADHLLHATTTDFEELSNNNTVAMFMPLATFGLFSNQLPQGHDLTNVVIGLGSDFNPNNWSINMQSAIRMAVYRYKLSPLDAIAAATSGSYQGLYGEKMNKLEIGAPATFLLIESTSLAEFVSKFGQNLVRFILKNGRIILENKHHIA